MTTPSIIKRLLIVALPLLFYFAVAGRSKFFNDADTFWHVAVGHTTLKSGLITNDHFSFTRYGEPWLANQWLAECILAVADSLGGLDGVLVLTVAVLTATYVALGYRWLIHGFDPLLTLAFVTLVLSASAYTLNARPHIVSIGFIGFVFAMLRDIEDGQRRPSQFFWLVPLFVIWSNLHGGVLGGLGSILLAAAGWTALCLLGKPSPISGKRGTCVVWSAAAACVLAILATPYGIGSLQAWVTIMTMPLPDLIIEHAPLNPRSPQGALVVLLCIFYAAVFAATPRAWLRPTFWLPLVWFLLTCQRIRHAPLFAIVAGIAMADLLPQSRLGGWLARRHWLRPVSVSNAPRLHVAAIVLILTAPLFGAAIWLKHVGPLPLISAGWARPTPRVWPAGLIEPLTSYAAEHPDGTPVFNEPIFGGFLIKNFPTLRVFIDGRCELYGERILQDFVAAWHDPSRIRSWQVEYGFHSALIEANSPLRTYFDNNDQWRLVAQTPAALFYRIQPPTSPGVNLRPRELETPSRVGG